MEYLYQISAGNKAQLIPQSESDYTEQEIEDLLQNNPTLVTGSPLLFIGRQVVTSSSKRMDLLAIDKSARLVVVELKRGAAPRDIIAQVLDYSSWLSQLSEREIEKIAKEYFQRIGAKYRTLSEAYKEFTGWELDGHIGGEIVSVLFAQEFTEGVTQPVNYLNKNGLPIVCVQFEMYKEANGTKYLYTQFISGELEDDNEEEIQKPIPEKIKIRTEIGHIVNYLEENIGSWSSSLSAEKIHPFKVYQGKDGLWSCAYIDWMMEDGAKLVLEFGIDMNEENPRFCVYIHPRKRSNMLVELIDNRKKLSEYFSEFEDEGGTEGRPELAKYSELTEISFESVKNKIDSELIYLKPIIEEILDGIE